MSKPARHKLAEISKLIGAGKKLAWGFDTHSTPGKVIVHTIQFDTHHIDAGDFADMTFPTLHNDNDPRLKHFAQCITP